MREYRPVDHADPDAASSNDSSDRLRQLGFQRRLLQRRAQGRSRPDAATSVLEAASSTGRPLPPELREQYSQSLGADLGNVRIHEGAASADAAEAVGARAYTTGNDIHFAQGEYDPGSERGRNLLAHEVAHTVQQSRGGAPTEDGEEDSASESAADGAAEKMKAGQPADPGVARGVQLKKQEGNDGGYVPGMTDFGNGKIAFPKNPDVSQLVVELLRKDARFLSKVLELQGRAGELDMMKLVGKTPAAEIGNNVSANVWNAAQNMDDSATHRRIFDMGLHQSLEDLGIATRELELAQISLNVVGWSSRAKILRAKVDRMKKGSDRALKITEGLIDVFKGMAGKDINPVDVAKGLFKILTVIGEMVESTPDEAKEAEQLEKKSESGLLEVALGHFEVASTRIGSLRGRLTELHAEESKADEKYAARREVAEGLYDKETEGGFRFKPLVERLKICQRFSEDCKATLAMGQECGPLAEKVRIAAHLSSWSREVPREAYLTTLKTLDDYPDFLGKWIWTAESMCHESDGAVGMLERERSIGDEAMRTAHPKELRK
jgi:hypothetical protein